MSFGMPVSLLVVRTLTADLAFTARASLSTKWLRRVPVRRGLVRFLGLPINNPPLSLIDKLSLIKLGFILAEKLILLKH